MPKIINVQNGTRFGKLVIIEEIEQSKRRRFLCQCDCGNTHEVRLGHLRSGHTKSCGCINLERFANQTGKNNPNWKGGKRIESSGYVEIYLPNHPYSRQTGYIKEHRLVMEKKLGRYLTENENVHHLNGDKTDNREENLELWNTSQPSGQRIEDKLKWAKQIIKLYE